MKNILLVPNKSKEEINIQTQLIKEYFEKWWYNVSVADCEQDEHGNYKYNCQGDFDYIMSIGGDGTFLQAVHSFKDKNAIFTGINMGHLGFLTQIPLQDKEHFFKQLIDNFYYKRSYNLLKVETNVENFHDECLNDVVIGRNGFARIIELEIYVDESLLYKFSGDGVLISTAIGSTAYNLSLGGPIVHPKSKTVVITPIAPHSVSIKPIVIPSDYKIDVKVIGGHKQSEKDAILTCDGRRNNIFLKNEDVVNISQGSKVHIADFVDNDYFKNIKDKLSN